MKHTGTLFKEVLYRHGITLEDLAAGRQQQFSEVAALFEKPEWTDSEIKALSRDTDIDFGRFCSPWDYEPLKENQREFSLYVRYPQDDKKQLMDFLDRVRPLAQEMGIELQ